MINKPTNWENVQEFAERKTLPLDAYVCKIKKAVLQNNTYGDQLCILFDISEGDYARYYSEEYEANTAQEKKWKGVLRLFLPTNDGSDKDEWTKRTLKGFVTAVERSNPGYVWNWNEQSLAGRTVGIMMRNEEWAYNGKTGWNVRPFRAIFADSVRNEEFTLPKDKPLNPLTNTATSAYADTYNAPSAPSTPPYSVADFKPLANDDDVPF